MNLIRLAWGARGSDGLLYKQGNKEWIQDNDENRRLLNQQVEAFALIKYKSGDLEYKIQSKQTRQPDAAETKPMQGIASLPWWSAPPGVGGSAVAE